MKTCCNHQCDQGRLCTHRAPFAPGVVSGPHRASTPQKHLTRWLLRTAVVMVVIGSLGLML